MVKLEFKWAQGRPELWSGVKRVAVLNEAETDLDALQGWLDRANGVMEAYDGDDPAKGNAAEQLDEIKSSLNGARNEIDEALSSIDELRGKFRAAGKEVAR